jgi:hypothetical protein
VAVDRQVGEELLDLRPAHRVGVAHAVKADEACGPLGVAGLGARRVVADAQGAAQAVEQARRLGVGQIAEIDAEQALVEEGQRLAGFFETAEGVLLGLGEVFEEAGDVGEAQFAGMADAVEEDEAACPVGEAPAGLGPAEVGQRGLAELVEQARGLRGGRGGERLEGWRGHGRTSLNGERAVAG